MEYEWFDEYGNLTKEIPEECVKDCYHQGQCYDDVDYWVEQLNFKVPLSRARDYLVGFGAWDDIYDCSEETLAQRVLWLACADIHEEGEWFGLYN